VPLPVTELSHIGELAGDVGLHLAQHLKEREDELVRERRLFDSKLVQQGDRITLDIDLRLEELTKLRETKMKEFKQVEKKAAEEQGAAPTEMKQNHRNQILAIEELMSTERERMEKFRDSEAEEAEVMFARAEKIKRGEMERRRATAGDNIARIRLEVSRKIRSRELEWQGKCRLCRTHRVLLIQYLSLHCQNLTLSPSHGCNPNRTGSQVATSCPSQGTSKKE
jgi:hypothetical protein